MKGYNEYQKRYSENIKESDKIIIRLVKESICKKSQKKNLSLLDIGCSTGNLLFHLKKNFPNLELTGGDLAESSIKLCKNDPNLAGINFKIMNMLTMGLEDKDINKFDFIVANAVTVCFSNNEYKKAISSVANSLKIGGVFLAFEWLHPFNQDIEILETSRSHPEGLSIHFRPYSIVSKILIENGLTQYQFRPFSIPIDLHKGITYGDNKDGFEDINSYTVKTEDGERMIFRGTLYQPWCHLIAKK